MNTKVFKMMVGMVMALCLMSAPIQAKAQESVIEDWITELEEENLSYSDELIDMLRYCQKHGFDDGVIIRSAKMPGGIYSNTDALYMVDYETYTAVCIIGTYNERHSDRYDEDIYDMTMYMTGPMMINTMVNELGWDVFWLD